MPRHVACIRKQVLASRPGLGPARNVHSQSLCGWHGQAPDFFDRSCEVCEQRSRQNESVGRKKPLAGGRLSFRGGSKLSRERGASCFGGRLPNPWAFLSVSKRNEQRGVAGPRRTPTACQAPRGAGSPAWQISPKASPTRGGVRGKGWRAHFLAPGFARLPGF